MRRLGAVAALLLLWLTAPVSAEELLGAGGAGRVGIDGAKDRATPAGRAVIDGASGRAAPADRAAPVGRAAPDNRARWLRIDTEHFRFIFAPGDERAVAELVEVAPSVYADVTGYLGWEPPRRVPVVVRGETALANGFYTTFPHHIELFVAAPSAPWLGAYHRSWLELVFVHELAHYVHLSRPLGFFSVPSRLFGPTVMTANMAWMPGWFIEGTGVAAETHFTDGGRGRNAFFEMAYAAPVLEGRMFTYDQAAYLSSYAPAGRIYVGGYAFVDYLERTYGDDIVKRLHGRYSAWPFLGMRRALRRETGERAAAVYAAMVDELSDRLDPRGAYGSGRIVHPAEPGDYYLPRRTETGWVGYRKTHRAGGALSVLDAARTTGHPAAGNEPDQWLETTPLTPTDPWSFSVSRDGRRAVAAVLAADPKGPFTSYSDLFTIEIDSGDTRRLTDKRRFYHPEIAPGGESIVAVERTGSYSRLVEFGVASGAERVIAEWPRSQLFTPRFSPDGTLLTAVVHERGRQELVLLHRLPNGAFSAPQRLSGLLPSPAAVWFPRFAGNRTVIFGSDLDGTLALYRLKLDSGRVERILRDAVGAFEGELVDGGVLYGSYSSDGYAVRFKPAAEMIREPVESVQGGTGARVLAPDDSSRDVAGEERSGAYEHNGANRGGATSGTNLSGAGPNDPTAEPSTHTAGPDHPGGRPSDPTAEPPAHTAGPDHPGGGHNYPAPRRYRDWPRPGLWLPLLALSGDAGGATLSAGALIMLASNLGNNTVTASGLWNADESEFAGTLAYTRRLRASRLITTIEGDGGGREAALSVERPLWYRRSTQAEHSLAGAVSTGYARRGGDLDVAFAGAAFGGSRRTAYPARAFYGGTATRIQAASTAAAEVAGSGNDANAPAERGWRTAVALVHNQRTGLGQHLLAFEGTVAAAESIDLNLSHRAHPEWSAPEEEKAGAIGAILYRMPLGIVDRGYGTSALLGIGIAPYLEVLAAGSAGAPQVESTAGGAEISADILVWNVPLRVTAGAATRLDTGDVRWYVRIEPPDGVALDGRGTP